MSEQVLQALFEDLDTANIEERARLKQKHYISLYGSSSKLVRPAEQLPARQILEDLHKAEEIYINYWRQL